MKIRPRPLIRILGTITILFAGLPSTIGTIILPFNLNYVVEDFWGPLFCVTLAIGLNYLAWRWFTIRGVIGKEFVEVRGLIRKYVVPANAIYSVREIRSVGRDADGSYEWQHDYHIFDIHDESLCRIPASLTICQYWKDFYRELRALSRENRDKTEVEVPEIYSREKPVDQWTAEDIERYESED